MALLICDSTPYDSATLMAGLKWNWVSNPWGDTLVVVNSGGPFNERHIACRNHGGLAGFGINLYPSTRDLWIGQCYFKVVRWGAIHNCQIFGLYDTAAANWQICLLLDENGLVTVRRGNYGGAVIATAPTAINLNVWNYFEVKFKVSHAAGTIDYRLNGVSEISLTGQDTTGTANEVANIAMFGQGYTTGENGIWDCAEFASPIVMDGNQVGGQNYCNDLLGIRRVLPCPPTSNGTYADYAPSAGSNFQCVDEVPQVESDYSATPDVNDKDTFNSTTDAVSGSTISAVACTMFAKNAAPVASKIKGYCKSGGSEAESVNELVVPGSSLYLQGIFYVDPATGVPFTAAAFNAAEFGYKRSA